MTSQDILTTLIINCKALKKSLFEYKEGIIATVKTITLQ